MFLKTKNQKRNSLIGCFIISLVAISIFLADISHTGLWYPDAPSHALNGVFYKDMIEDLGFFHPVSYAERYYVQYPGLTVGLYPPVFYTVEALFFKVLGISPLSARLTILSFSLIGVNIFFLLCRHWFPLWLSVLGSILYLLQPAILFGQKNVMLEMPALAMSMTALYCLYVGVDRREQWALFLAPLFTVLAFLTKQNAIFLLPIWLVWIIGGRKWNLIKSGYLISGVLIGTVVLIPWAAVSLTIGRSYVTAQVLQRSHIWANCLYYLRQSPEILTYPVILLVITSVILVARLRKHDGYRFALLWGAAGLLSLLPVHYREPRFAVFLVPAVIILSMQVIWLFREKFTFFQHRKVYAIVMIALICLHLNPLVVWGRRDIQGFDQAAEFVVRDPDCVSVLYDGYFNGNFIFHMRARDEGRRIFVFRASKVIFSTKMMLELGYNDLIKEVSEFHDVLERYSVKYIVQEEENLLNTPANRKLRQWVRAPKFRLVREYSIPCEGFRGFGDLLVYKYSDYEAKPIKQIDLDMPVLGRTFGVKVERENYP